MLSSITSFLPSALQHINSNSHANPPPEVDEDDDEEEQEQQVNAETKKKEKKEKPVNETFIFVRPPPAKSNHPLNLQVQLVPPNSRAPGVTNSATTTPRQSLDGPEPSTPSAESEADGAPLSRTESTRSSRSEYSSYSSSGYASTASFSSVGSTTSGRRMIIPLYNLQAHNVMTNTIVDAGTDAKTAKFTRKGLEMIDLAFLDVVEVWPTPTGPVHTNGNSNGGTGSARGSLDEAGSKVRRRLSTLSTSHLRPQQTSSRPTTPDAERFTPGSSVMSVSSAGLSSAADDHRPPELPPRPVPSAPQQKKNIFGKFFKKKDTLPSSSSSSPDTTPRIPPSSVSVTPASPNSPTPVKTPSIVPPSPTSRHGRNLSSSISNFGRRGVSASPSRPATSAGGEGSTLGIKGFMKHVRPSSMHVDPNEVQAHDYAYDEEFGGHNLSTTSSRMSTNSRTGNGSHLEPPSTPTGGSSFSSNNPITLPATLGIHPTLSTPGGPAALAAFSNFTSSGYPPRKNLGFGRGPALYVWVVRKWIKTPEGAFGSGGNGLFGLGSNADMHSGLTEMEVRVEWKRGKKSKSKKKSKRAERADSSEGRASPQKRRSIIASESSPMGSNTSLPVSETTSEAMAAIKRRNRLSATSRGSLTSTRHSTNGDDEGNESDPEDSEIPWTCTLKVRRLAGISGLPTSSESSTPLKTKVATLSPTPHHPKVVAMLKVPYPLPDLEVQTMTLRKRAAGPVGGLPPMDDKDLAGLVLRAEEIKDVVCSTGLWIVVREGFGGVGKVSRKGDGWRIRA